LDAIRKNLRKLLADDRGATAIEYGLIVAMIAVAAIGGFSAVGGGSTGMWTRLSNIVQNSTAP
jgi:pilus assembly protein Flp/PilA